MQVNWFGVIPTFAEVIPRQELLHGKVGSQPEEIFHSQLGKPI